MSDYKNTLSVNGVNVSLTNHTHSDYLLSSTYTASDVINKVKSGDGTGSGIDADLLDGYHASNFITSTILTDTKEPTGFLDQSSSNISYTNATRTFTISVVSGSYSVYLSGVKYNKTTTETVVWPAVEGVHYFYFNNTGTLVTSQTFFDLGDYAIIAYLYWDSTNNIVIIFGDERHGIIMDNKTHEYLHNTIGARYSSGLSASNFSIVGNGNNDVHCTLSLGGGVIYDEDLSITIVHSSTPTLPNNQFLEGTLTELTGTPTTVIGAKIPIYYRSGATGFWRKITAINAPVKLASNRIYYNQYTGSTWQLTESSNNYYVPMWIFATNNMYEPIIAIMGQAQNSTLATAKTTFTENTLSWGNISFREIKSLFRLIYQTSSSYNNSFKARLQDITDYRIVSSVSGVASASQTHAALSGLSSDDHAQYVLLEGRSGDAAINLQLNMSRVRQAPNQTLGNGTVTLNYANGDYFKVTATNNISLAFSNNPSGMVSSFTLECTNFGAYVISWPAGTKWAGAAAPTLTASGIDLINFMIDASANIYGFLLSRDIR